LGRTDTASALGRCKSLPTPKASQNKEGIKNVKKRKKRGKNKKRLKTLNKKRWP